MSFAKEDDWMYVNNFSELIKTNILFIKGILKTSPYHQGPLDVDSVPLIDKLVLLHKYGLFTTEGQSASCIHKTYIPKTKKYVNIEQKPYLCFLMRNNNTNWHFIHKHLFHNNLLVVMGTDLTKQGHYFHNITDSKYNVTREQTDENKEQLQSNPWRMYTNFHPNYPANDIIDMMSGDENKYHNLIPIYTQCIYVSVAMKEYCKGDLEQLILDECKNAGLKMCY